MSPLFPLLSISNLSLAGLGQLPGAAAQKCTGLLLRVLLPQFCCCFGSYIRLISDIDMCCSTTTGCCTIHAGTTVVVTQPPLPAQLFHDMAWRQTHTKTWLCAVCIDVQCKNVLAYMCAQRVTSLSQSDLQPSLSIDIGMALCRMYMNNWLCTAWFELPMQQTCWQSCHLSSLSCQFPTFLSRALANCPELLLRSAQGCCCECCCHKCAAASDHI